MKGLLIKMIIGCYLVAVSFQTFAALKIRFGVTYFYPPFVFSSNSGYIHGFDIDLAKAVCQQLKAECSFTPAPFAELLPGLQQNRFDAIMGALSITPERKTYVYFTRPYLKSPMSYVALANSNIDPNNLIGKRVGVQKDSTFYSYLLNKYSTSIKLVPFDTNEEVINALSNKQVDIVCMDTPAADYWVRFSSGLFNLVGTPIFLPFDEGYGIGVKKGNVALTNSLNNALNTLIQNGTVDKLKQAYFSKLPHPN